MKDSAREEFFRLLEAVREDRITPAEVERLEAILASDPQARDDYVHCLTMQGLFEQEVVNIQRDAAESDPEPPKPAAQPAAPPMSNSTRWALGVAFSVLFLLFCFGLAYWTNPSRQRDSNEPIASETESNWRVTPTGGARFNVVSPTLVELTSGEVHVQPTGLAGAGALPPLTVKTPAGEATIEDADCYVGFHETPSSKNGETEMKQIARILVLAGVATLTNQFGAVTGNANMLLAAEPDQAPAKITVQANNDFAFKLYSELGKEKESKNLFFSPYSISTVLAMAAQGARGETAREMGDVLSLPEFARRKGTDAQQIPWRTSLLHTGFASLNRRLASKSTPAQQQALQKNIDSLRTEIERKTEEYFKVAGDNFSNAESPAARKLDDQLIQLETDLEAAIEKLDPYQLKVANAMWLERTYPFRKEFIATINEHYDTGGAFPADFIHDFESERGRINQWVEEQTNNRIENLFPQGSLNELTRFVLTNAIYFKGEWETPFEEYMTDEREFFLADGNQVETPIMYAHELEVAKYAAFEATGKLFKTPQTRTPDQTEGLYPDADGFAMLQLPYKGDDVSMVIIAPNRPDNLPAIEAQLSSTNINRWVGQLASRTVNVSLPKFRAETDYTLGAAENPGALQRLGMKRAFVDPRYPNGADFTGLTTAKAPDRPYLSLVVHKAFIEVHERGAEAAAATGAAGGLGGIGPAVRFTPDFLADRPFVYFIREHSTGAILFFGRVMNPVQ